MSLHDHLPHSSSRRSASLATRARAWCHQFDLDRELAAGTDPEGSPQLRARAQQLTSVHFRRELIAQLDGALIKAEHPPHWHSAGLPVQCRDVAAAADALRALRAALHAATSSRVQGIALAACLLNDPDGPLYQAWPDGTIARLADAATSALAVDEQPASPG
jgi:hypothetical protein